MITTKELINELENIYILTTASTPDIEQIQNLVEDTITKVMQGVKCPKKTKPSKRISKRSQKGLLLRWLQKHPDYKVTAIDIHPNATKFDDLPFLGAKPGSRLSELKSLGLVTIV